MKRLVKFWRLPAAERRLLVSALAYLAAYRVGLWLLPLASLLRRSQTSKVSETFEVSIDPDLAGVRVRLAPDVAAGIAGLLVMGNVMAAVLTLTGEAILHASVVALDGAALAFLGSSGMGKSSLAGQLCASGARFITDDLLRLQADGADWRCYPGAGQLRLRPDAAARCRFPAELLEPTPDGRIAVDLAPAPTMPRLAAIVIPHPSRNCDALQVERIPRDKALLIRSTPITRFPPKRAKLPLDNQNVLV